MSSSSPYTSGVPQARTGDVESRPLSPATARRSSDSSTSTLAHSEHRNQHVLPDITNEKKKEQGEGEKTPVLDENGRDPAFLVDWDGPDDPANPLNWKRLSRWVYTVLGGVLVLNATFASSAPAGVVNTISMEFGFGREVGTLLISLFVAGYAVGPLFWGPLSETIGRRTVFITSFVFYTGFQVGCALSKNTASILIFRFLSGCFAASPLANAGSLMGDMWDPQTRGKALSIFTLAPFAGPALGPVVGGFITVGGASWRWLFWVCTMFAGLCLTLVVFILPETYAPVILKHKAQQKRKETGDSRWYSHMEAKQISRARRVKDIVSKPFLMLIYEPMLLAVTVYMSFVYGCLYLLFEAYPIVFTEGHGFNAGVSGLMYLPIFLGGALGAMISVFYYNPKYVKLTEEYERSGENGGVPPPEARLPMSIYGGVVFAIGFFWFGWTSYPSISFWSPMIAGGCVGLSLVFLFLSLFNYIIDTYLFESASALSANTVVRSLFGAGFPLFATQMYTALNPRWASTLLGLVAVVMIPIPLLFVRYGPALRARSRFSPTMVDDE